jgi:hypothetical protein
VLFDANNQRGGSSSLLLPFLDDFSRYSLATNDPEIPADWQRYFTKLVSSKAGREGDLGYRFEVWER